MARWAAAMAVAVLAAGCSSTSGAQVPPSAVPPTIDAASTPQFKTSVLTNSAGFAIYIFQPDHAGRSTCTGACAVAWPPILLAADQHAIAGPGVEASLLGTEPYSGHQSVVTYNGWPLYSYKNDTTAGVAAGQALNLNGGYWYVMQTDGTPVVPAGYPPAA
jgi:predicted lipoprotein with Yx(FWY)xxD motif